MQFAPGFQLIYGPNEAGKSTLLQLIRELLFGFPHRSPYSFDSGKLEAEAAINLRDDQRVTFRRRKGRGRTVTGVIDGGATDIDDASLSRLLGNASGKLYEHVFGFSLKELASGEESLKHANLSEALYGGGLGGLTNFQKLREEIQAEHEKLFNPRGRGSNQEINRILNELKESRKTLKQSIVSPRDYKEAEKAEKQASEVVESLRRERENLQRRSAHSSRLLKALEPFLKLCRLREELAAAGCTVRISEQASEQHRTQLQRLDELSEEATRLEAEKAQAVRQLQALTLQPDVLNAETSIKRLQQDVGRIRGFMTALPRQQQEVQQLQDDVANDLKRLQPDWSLDDLERFQVTEATEAAFTELADELRQFSEKQRTNDTRLDEAQSSMERLQRELAQLEEIPADPKLIVFVEEDRAILKQRDDAATAAGQLATLDALVQNSFARLSPQLEAETLRKIESLPIPAEATLQEFRQRFTECDREFEQARQQLKRDRDELSQRERDRDDLTQQSDVPSRDDLDRQRQRRDSDWLRIRRVLIEGGDEPGIQEVPDGEQSATINVTLLPDRFEEQIQKADQLADERQSHAEVVARLDTLMVTIARARDRVADSEAAIQAVEEQRRTLLDEWAEVWSGFGFAPLRPEVMLEWRTAFCQIVSNQQECSRLRRQIEYGETSVAEFVTSLSTMLDETSQGKADAAPTGRKLDVLLSAAQQRVEQARATARDRERLKRDFSEQTDQLDRLREKSLAMVDQQKSLDQRRTELLQKLGLPTDWTVTIAERILNGLAAARLKLDQARRLEQQIAEMTAECEHFSASQRELCRNVADDLIELAPPDAIARLSELLSTARHTQQSYESGTQNVQRLSGEIETLHKRRLELEDRLRKSRESAGVEADDEFFAIAQASIKQQQIENEIGQYERSIALLRETEDEAAFLADLEAADPDQLAATCREFSEEQSALDEKYEVAVEDRKSARLRLEEFNQASTATSGQQKVESELAKLSDAVDRWAPLVLARAIMSRAIREFELNHQPALFEEVSRLFSRMTNARYVGLSQKLDEDRTLQLEQADGIRKSPDQLSTGTREQLYLAIRLAYVQQYCRDSEPLPLIMDDILVNFDEQRATNTLEVLFELPNEIQVLFLTCHEHMTELIRKLRPDLTPIELAQA